MLVLNQGTLSDEAKVGFALVILLCFLEVMNLKVPLPYTYAKIGEIAVLTNKHEAIRPLLAPIQLVLLASVIALISAVRQRVMFHRLGARPIDEVDSSLASAFDELAVLYGRASMTALVTSNMNDGNALCFRTSHGPTIVLGGGLRLLYRRDRSRTMGLMAHEMAHANSADVGLVLVALYAFLGLIALSAADLMYTEISLVLSAPWHEIQGTYDLTRVLAPQLVLPLIVIAPIAGLFVVLLYLVRSREFLADDWAARLGLSGSLLVSLQDRSSEASCGKRSPFHPSPSSRVRRIVDPRSWARLDLMFLVALFFVSSHASDALDQTIYQQQRPLNLHGTLFEVLPTFLGSLPLEEILRTVLSLAIKIFTIGAASHYIYRLVMTRLALGERWWTFFIAIAMCLVAVMAGTALGELTSYGFIQEMLARAPTKPDFIRLALEEPGAAALAPLAFFPGAVLLATISIRRPARRRPFGWFMALVACSLGFYFLLSLSSYFLSVGLGYDFVLDADVSKPTKIISQTLLTSIYVSALLVIGLLALLLPRQGIIKVHFTRLREMHDWRSSRATN